MFHEWLFQNFTENISESFILYMIRLFHNLVDFIIHSLWALGNLNISHLKNWFIFFFDSFIHVMHLNCFHCHLHLLHTSVIPPLPYKSLSYIHVVLWLTDFNQVVCGLEWSIAAWWAHQWAHNWRQWLFILQKLSAAKKSSAGRVKAPGVPVTWLTVGRFSIGQVQWRCCDMFAMAVSFPEDGIHSPSPYLLALTFFLLLFLRFSLSLRGKNAG